MLATSHLVWSLSFSSVTKTTSGIAKYFKNYLILSRLRSPYDFLLLKKKTHTRRDFHFLSVVATIDSSVLLIQLKAMLRGTIRNDDFSVQQSDAALL